MCISLTYQTSKQPKGANKLKMQVARIIFEQLGANRFAVMTGSRNFVTTQNSLRMDLARNSSSANRLEITLESDDTYTMHFYRLTMGKQIKLTTIAKEEGVYCDQLQQIFTAKTGLYTKL